MLDLFLKLLSFFYLFLYFEKIFIENFYLFLKILSFMKFCVFENIVFLKILCCFFKKNWRLGGESALRSSLARYSSPIFSSHLLLYSFLCNYLGRVAFQIVFLFFFFDKPAHYVRSLLRFLYFCGAQKSTIDQFLFHQVQVFHV